MQHDKGSLAEYDTDSVDSLAKLLVNAGPTSNMLARHSPVVEQWYYCVYPEQTTIPRVGLEPHPRTRCVLTNL